MRGFQFQLSLKKFVRHRIYKKNSISVTESDILIDATIPFQSLGDMRKYRTQARRSI